MRILGAALLVALLLPNVAHGAHLGPLDERGRHVIAVVYPTATMVEPRASFDRNDTILGIPVGEGAGQAQETFAAYERAYLRAAGAQSYATFVLELAMEAAPLGEVAIRITLRNATSIPLNVSLLEVVRRPDTALFEAFKPVVPVSFQNGTQRTIQVGRPLEGALFVVFAADTDGAVIQSALLDPRVGARTTQTGRAVLVEVAVGDGCARCGFALAAANALVQSLEKERLPRGAYSRAWGLEVIAIGVIGAVALQAAWPRIRGDGPEGEP